MAQRGDLIDVTVGPPGHGGFCIARFEGQAVFVRHALPGERVRARVTEVRGSYLRADAVEVLEPSADRVVPPCPHTGPGKCGGCDWQHASLPAQRALKAAVIVEQFRRLAGLDVTVEVEPADPVHDDELGPGLGWRTRVTYAVDKRGQAGLRRHRSHEIQPIDTCLIAHANVRSLGVPAITWRGAASIEALASGTGERAIVAEPREGMRIRPEHPDPEVIVARRGRSDVVVQRGAAALTERADGHDWRVGFGSFWQIHPASADTLVHAALGFALPQPGERALDLYAGVGLFARALATAVGATGLVIAVESGRSAVADARVNCSTLPQVVVREEIVRPGVVPDVARDLGGPVDIVLLDPPRTGAGAGVVADIAAAGPRAVVYVACDPAALARDVASFATAGYTLAGLRAFDLFPMTAHVECVALLTCTQP